MLISVSYYTATGKREINEDAVSFQEGDRSFLAIVADGLGGHSRGEVASCEAVSSINRLLKDKEPEEDALVNAIRQASKNIYALRKNNVPLHTTVVALWLGEKKSYVANVGDSRIYQFRDGKIVFQSLDHSVAQMAVLIGEMAPSGIRESKDRNRLIRALGDGNETKVDVHPVDIRVGDQFLLCSDGFWEAVTEEDMQRLLSESNSVHPWLQQMRALVDSRDKATQDNHTAIAIWTKDK